MDQSRQKSCTHCGKTNHRSGQEKRKKKCEKEFEAESISVGTLVWMFQVLEAVSKQLEKNSTIRAWAWAWINLQLQA